MRDGRTYAGFGVRAQRLVWPVGLLSPTRWYYLTLTPDGVQVRRGRPTGAALTGVLLAELPWDRMKVGTDSAWYFATGNSWLMDYPPRRSYLEVSGLAVRQRPYPSRWRAETPDLAPKDHAQYVLPGMDGAPDRMLSALLDLLAARPNWRRSVTDPGKITALVEDIEHSPWLAAYTVTHGRMIGDLADARRVLDELDAKPHRVQGRPIAGDPLPDATALATVVAERVKTRWHPADADAATIKQAVEEYLTVEQWPFGALRPTER